MFDFKEMCRMIMIFVFVQNVIHLFFKGSGPEVKPTDLQRLEVNGSLLSEQSHFVSSTHLQNYLRNGEPFMFDTYLSFMPNHRFFKGGGIRGKTPEWHEDGLYYNYASSNERHLNLSIPVTEKLHKMNNTLYLHMQVTVRNPLYINKRDSHELAYKAGTQQ
jgi:hypothetical protein